MSLDAWDRMVRDTKKTARGITTKVYIENTPENVDLVTEIGEKSRVARTGRPVSDVERVMARRWVEHYISGGMSVHDNLYESVRWSGDLAFQSAEWNVEHNRDPFNGGGPLFHGPDPDPTRTPALIEPDEASTLHGWSLWAPKGKEWRSSSGLVEVMAHPVEEER